jgi:hypothetical protein
MKNSNFAKSYLFTNKVNVNLNMLGTTMLNWIGCHVDCKNIVTINDCSLLERSMEFSKKLAKPHGLSESMGDSSVFSLRSGNCNLPFGRPRNNIITQINTKARCRLPSIWTTCPVCIRINCQACWRRRINKKTVIKSAFKIPKNAFDMSKMRRTRIMHIETCLLNIIGNIRTSKSGML